MLTCHQCEKLLPMAEQGLGKPTEEELKTLYKTKEYLLMPVLSYENNASSLF